MSTFVKRKEMVLRCLCTYSASLVFLQLCFADMSRMYC